VTRVLVWNIQFFTQSRIMPDWFDDVAGKPPGWDTYAWLQEIQQRTRACRELIEETVTAVDPDIFAVVEARTSQGNVMELADGNGPAGLRTLCQTLRHNLNGNWCLVPPLRINPRDDLALNTYTETVGVFYRADRMQFTGPYVWPGTDAGGTPSPTGPPVPPGTAPYAAARYPDPWYRLLPPGTTAAACCRYFKGQQEVLFTQQLNRRPYCTDFTNLNTGHPFRLFTVHFRPDAEARGGLINLVDRNEVPPAWTTPSANQTIVVAGDFNIDLRHDTVHAINAAAREGYELLRPYVVLVGGHLGFPPSTLLRLGNATDDSYLKDESYDYGLARWGAGVRPNPVPAFPGLVGDVVRGVQAIPNLGYVPVIPFNSRMQDSLATIAGTPGGTAARDARFRLRANYGRISPPGNGLSDHFPAAMEA